MRPFGPFQRFLVVWWTAGWIVVITLLIKTRLPANPVVGVATVVFFAGYFAALRRWPKSSWPQRPPRGNARKRT